MNIRENVPLKDYTTFRVGGNAQFFCDVGTVDELIEAVTFARDKAVPFLVLGGGSNVLVSDEGFNGLVARVTLKGISFVSRDSHTLVTAGAGENWDDFVRYTVSQGLYGIENLSYIPGTVGAAPVQNIGAYGVEIQSIVETVTALDTDTMKIVTFNNRQCEFAYRNSYFKKSDGKGYIITSVTFRLTPSGNLNFEYKDIAQYYTDNPSHPKTLAGIRDAVIAIRKNKLPDWTVLGTAGSFFKNPIITKDHYQTLRKKYPEIPSYIVRDHDVRGLQIKANDAVKVPLGWILDHVCGYKGLKRGPVGVYERQSLVLVNFGNATAAEVKRLAEEMTLTVKNATGIMIEPEVQYVG